MIGKSQSSYRCTVKIDVISFEWRFDRHLSRGDSEFCTHRHTPNGFCRKRIRIARKRDYDKFLSVFSSSSHDVWQHLADLSNILYTIDISHVKFLSQKIEGLFYSSYQITSRYLRNIDFRPQNRHFRFFSDLYYGFLTWSIYLWHFESNEESFKPNSSCWVVLSGN